MLDLPRWQGNTACVFVVLVNARVDRVLERHVAGSPRRHLELDGRRGVVAAAVVHAVHGRRRLVPAVGDLPVPDVEDVVERLQEGVRLLDAVPLAGHADAVLAEQRRVARERRLLLGRPQVGEDEPADLDAWVGRVLHCVLHPAAGGFGGRLQAMAFAVVLPPVVQAAQSIVLDPPEPQGRAPVGAVLRNESRLAGCVPEQDEVLAQHRERQWILRAGDDGASAAAKVPRCLDGQPVPAEQLARRRAWAQAKQLFFLFVAEGHCPPPS